MLGWRQWLRGASDYRTTNGVRREQPFSVCVSGRHRWKRDIQLCDPSPAASSDIHHVARTLLPEEPADEPLPDRPPKVGSTHRDASPRARFTRVGSVQHVFSGCGVLRLERCMLWGLGPDPVIWLRLAAVGSRPSSAVPAGLGSLRKQLTTCIGPVGTWKGIKFAIRDTHHVRGMLS